MNRFELTVPAKTECLDELTEFVESHLEEVMFPMAAVMQIDIAVEEIFVNIASYAYPDREDGTATLQMEVSEDPKRVYMTFIDSGIPYDPLAKADPDVTLSADERTIGGLGIFMVKKSMDEMSYKYEDGKNILSMMMEPKKKKK